MARAIMPIFTPTTSSPQAVFFDNHFQNEAFHTLQFLTLFHLMRESIKTANGELLLSLYKPCLPVFDRYHRTKYR